MKTVCFVVPAFPITSETFVVQQIIQAQQHGYHVQVLTNNLLDLSETSQQTLLEDSNIMDKVVEVNIKIPKSKFNRRLSTLYFIIRFFKYWIHLRDIPLKKRFSTIIFKIKFYYQFKKVDVFHVQFALAGLELAEMKAIGLLKGKIITTFHGYDAHFNDELARDIMGKRYKKLLNISSAITVNTPYLASIVKRIGVEEAKLHIVPMGIDVDFFCNEKERTLLLNKKIKVLSVGRLVALKGFKYALHAIKQVVDAGYDVIYTIVGAGEEEKDLKCLIDVLGLTANVFMLGKQNQKEVKALMQNHDIFIMSSITDSTGRQETQGVVTAEAQAMGLPVVAFKSGGVPYTIRDEITGYLVGEKDTGALAEAIISILEKPNSYEKMSASARLYAVKEFSNAMMGERFNILYN